jgi:metallo-beta-lactamase family protein
MATVTVFGAVRTVTGSMHLVEAGDTHFLLDCGLFQGRRADAFEINSHFPFPPSSIGAVVLSHAHLDHCGNLPTLVQQGFRGAIYCTPATRDLAALILRDSAKVQAQDLRFVNKLRAKQGLPPTTPLYTDDDAERAITHFTTIPYRRPFQVGPATCTFYDAGHILGSAVSVVEAEGRTLVFSGDLGRRGAAILRDAEVPPAGDVVLMESTYGDRVHDSYAHGEEVLATAVVTVVGRGGKVLVPALAVGRTQDLTYALHRMQDAGRIPAVPTFVDSPMAVDATEIFRLHPECFNDQTRTYLDQGDPFGFKKLHYVRAAEESQRLNDLADPFVVLATSGMCESGRILHPLRHHVGDPRSALLIVSFQAEHTLGRRLVDGASPVNIFGEPYEVRLQVQRIDAFSAHGDRDDLVGWVRRIPHLGHVFLVHGEEAQSLALVDHLRTQGVDAAVPVRGQRISV